MHAPVGTENAAVLGLLRGSSRMGKWCRFPLNPEQLALGTAWPTMRSGRRGPCAASSELRSNALGTA
jgi:hypothetical protein